VLVRHSKAAAPLKRNGRRQYESRKRDQQRASASKERDEANARAAEADQKSRVQTKNAMTHSPIERIKDTNGVECGRGNSNLNRSWLTRKKLCARSARTTEARKRARQREKTNGDLQTQLAASQNEQTYQTTVAQLRSQLDDASKQLEQVKLVGATRRDAS